MNALTVFIGLHAVDVVMGSVGHGPGSADAGHREVDRRSRAETLASWTVDGAVRLRR